MSGKRFVLIVAIMVMFIPSTVMAQDPMGNLKVVVKDFYDDTPVVEAQVLITPCNDTGITDSNGEYLFTSVTPFRNYQVDVEAVGFISRSAGFVTVEADQEAIAHIPLKQESTIAGQVTDGSSPLAGVTILLGHFEAVGEDQEFVAAKAGKTDGGGMYSLEHVDEASYKIVALLDGYLKNIVDLEAVAGQSHIQNFTLVSGGSSSATIFSIVVRTSYNGDPLALPTFKGKRVYIDGRDSSGVENFFWVKETIPPDFFLIGEEYYLGAVFSFIIPASGDYTVKLLATDSAGVVISDSVSFSAANVNPEAVVSVIPGPSELPYIYNSQVLASTSGSTYVPAGDTVYLRGFAMDKNQPTPQEYNPDAPCFDVYENKNGNFSASIFDYEWTLKDKNDTDLTHLLTPSATSENVSFTIPGTPAGDYFVASLTVADDELATSDPEEVTITVAMRTGQSCSNMLCHPDINYGDTAHATEPDGADCQDCHGLGSVHVSDPSNKKLSSSYWSGVCGQCHLEFAEMQKTNHSDPLPFGYFEPSSGRLSSCYKCHYTPGYIGAMESGTPFKNYSYFPWFDDSLVPRDTPNVSCSVCHDPHEADSGNPYGLRTGSAGTACDTCHYEKWHNAILEGIAGEVENGYHYPGEDYTPFLGENNPHRTEGKCVHCHMDETLSITDANGVLKIGGHTLRMRDYGDDQVPETGDDILNLAACQNVDCHPGLTDFDRNGFQTEIKALLSNLGDMLKGENHDFLPGFQPGNCARCHKGGTVPFVDDFNNVLENAYTNYKLVLNDRSWGIHNPGYVEKLLQASINSIESVLCEGDFDCDGDCDGSDAASFKADFGRSIFVDPCTNGDQCQGDFDCDVDVDGTDAALFKADFGRSTFSNPCPACEVGDWCSYP